MTNTIYFYPWDRFLAKTVLRLFPKRIRPNHVTVLRLLLTPAVVYILWAGHPGVGAVFFILVAFTDVLDGSMARTRNQITEWGKLYDPVADKLLIGSALFVLVLKHVDMYAAWIIIILEVVTIFSAFLKRHYNHSANFQANIWGKIKMVLQTLGVLCLLLAISLNVASLLPFTTGVFYLAIAFGIMSLFTYGI